MVQAISVQSKTTINSQALVCRDYPAPAPEPFFACALGGTVIDVLGGPTGFSWSFSDLLYYIQYQTTFFNVFSTAPFTSNIAFRILSNTMATENPISSVLVSASVSGSPSSIANVRIWYSYTDYLNNNSPNLSQIINSNPLTNYCFVPDLDGSVVRIDLQSVAAPGTNYPIGYLTGTINAVPLSALSGECFMIANATDKAYAVGSAEPATTCGGSATEGFGLWRASCLGSTNGVVSSLSWLLGNDGSQVVAVSGTYSYGTRSATGSWNWLGYLPAGIEWGSITGNGSVSLVIASLNSNTTTYAYRLPNVNVWLRKTLPIIGITAVRIGSDFIVTPSGNTLAYSTDGLNWSTATLPSSENWVGCFFAGDNNYYLFSISGKIIKSNSLTGPWTTVANTTKTFYKVVYGMYLGTETFVAITAGHILSYSTDRGATWSDVVISSLFPNVSIQDIAYGAAGALTYFVVTNSSPSGNQIFYSRDGINWNNSYSSASNFQSAFSITTTPYLI